MAENQGKSETAKREEEVLKFWSENRTFEESLEKDAPKGEFVFYDGPPFATGLPHHGSLLSSIIKDVIPRYKTMRGYRVRRRWGWDTHGLPIESLVEKELGLKTKKDILDIGVAAFNEKAKSMVLQFVHDWEKYVERIGRWVDFKNSYKTMDNTYIESVWWALKKLWDKELLYEGKKVLMYCPHCETPLAKAEIAMDNTYKDITEEAVTVKFKVKNPEKHGLPANTYLLAWTTTPWTLPGNVALAVGSDIKYLVIKWAGDVVVAAETFKSEYPGEILKEVSGEDLVGIEYEPLFDIKQTQTEKSHKVYAADFVTTGEGTGIVHTAVMYGEDDFVLGQKEGLPMVQLLNPNGTYNDQVPENLRGKYIKDAERDIKRDLQDRGLLFKRENNTHSYPHCYRCGTPLIYNAVSSWFINIQKVKAKMLSENQKVNWVPDHLKNGRFGNIVESAPDWTISRNRFWASPLPVWKSKEGKVMVVGSIDDIKKRVKKSGNSYFVMRHGETDANVKKIVNSDIHADIYLTQKGKEEVAKAAKQFLATPFDYIYTSPFPRTHETAEIVAKVTGYPIEKIIVDDRLREVAMGEMSGKTLEEWHAAHPESVERFSKGPMGGETNTDVKIRMGSVLLDLEKKYSNARILIVSHGTPVWLLFAAAVGASKEEAIAMYKREYPKTGEIEPVPFLPLPMNKEFELDLHRPYIDDIVLLDDEGSEYRRILEVVDCWVESGSMPFAEYHYPFENKEEFETRAPGDFIAEYIAQTRTWFYYMHAMGILLFGRLAFRNVVSTGNLLAADGSKISKSKRNYTDPLELIDQYGSDAIRLSLMGSPIMQAEDVRFRDEDVRDAHNRVIGILWNSFKFYELYKHEYDLKAESRASQHVLDRWVLARLDETTQLVTEAMDAYDTPSAVRAIRAFVDEYSTWYVRRSRERVKSEWHDKQYALATQRDVLATLSRLVAPIMPFIAESIWQGLGERPQSVHLAAWPRPPRVGIIARLFSRKSTVLEDMKVVRALVSKALEARDKAGHKIRQPLLKLEIPQSSLGSELLDVIRDEVNVKEVAFHAGLKDGEISLDTTLNDDLRAEGVVREIIRALQAARKTHGLKPGEKARASVTASEAACAAARKVEAEILETASLSAIAWTPADVQNITVVLSTE